MKKNNNKKKLYRAAILVLQRFIMNIKSLTKASYLQYGCFFDCENLHEDIAPIFDRPITKLNWYLASIKETRNGQETDLPHYEGYIINPGLNAGALHIPGIGSSVILNNSTPVLLLMNCMMFAHRCDPKIAMPLLENGGIAHYNHKTILVNRLFAPLSTGDEAFWYLNKFASQFEEENTFGTFLFELAMDFLVMHEVFHITMGHANYASQRSGHPTFLELSTERNVMEAGFSHMFEFIADRNAVLSLGNSLLAGNYSDWYKESLVSEATVDEPTYLVRSLMLATTLLFHLFAETPFNGIGDKTRQHPHPYMRSMWMLQEAGKGFQDRVDFITGMLDAVSNTVATLHFNFHTPAAWKNALEEDQRSNGSLSNASFQEIHDLAVQWQTVIQKEYGPIFN